LSAIAARSGIGRGVQRLVDVTQEMDQKTQFALRRKPRQRLVGLELLLISAIFRFTQPSEQPSFIRAGPSHRRMST
jgi:hypothetical protein